MESHGAAVSSTFAVVLVLHLGESSAPQTLPVLTAFPPASQHSGCFYASPYLLTEQSTRGLEQAHSSRDAVTAAFSPCLAHPALPSSSPRQRRSGRRDWKLRGSRHLRPVISEAAGVRTQAAPSPPAEPATRGRVSGVSPGLGSCPVEMQERGSRESQGVHPARNGKHRPSRCLQPPGQTPVLLITDLVMLPACLVRLLMFCGWVDFLVLIFQERK